MQFVSHYDSPLGGIEIAADHKGIIGLWFVGQKYFGEGLDRDSVELQTEVLEQARVWLDIYFSGAEAGFTPPLHLQGTEFQRMVCRALLDIPYGHTIAYGEIAKSIAVQMGRDSMSAQAVGAAVGRNRISLIVPCHRVIGTNGNLTGYAGGIERKARLLELETAR